MINLNLNTLRMSLIKPYLKRHTNIALLKRKLQWEVILSQYLGGRKVKGNYCVF